MRHCINKIMDEIEDPELAAMMKRQEAFAMRELQQALTNVQSNLCADHWRRILYSLAYRRIGVRRLEEMGFRVPSWRDMEMGS